MFYCIVILDEINWSIQRATTFCESVKSKLLSIDSEEELLDLKEVTSE